MHECELSIRKVSVVFHMKRERERGVFGNKAHIRRLIELNSSQHRHKYVVRRNKSDCHSGATVASNTGLSTVLAGLTRWLQHYMWWVSAGRSARIRIKGPSTIIFNNAQEPGATVQQRPSISCEICAQAIVSKFMSNCRSFSQTTYVLASKHTFMWLLAPTKGITNRDFETTCCCW